MHAAISVRSLGLVALATVATAQFPPEPKGVKVLRSKFHENVTISYKENTACEDIDGIGSYSGYIHLPPNYLDDKDRDERQDYAVNTFFWFTEARTGPETAPLAIWLNGGPGGSSLLGMLGENGPCFVNADSKTVEYNPWSWNNMVNMLYIDEPNQVGFSYDEMTNCTVRLPDEPGMDFDVTPIDLSSAEDIPEQNATFRVGTLGSQNDTHTANSTAQAAHALWHFVQTWVAEFPEYRPSDDRLSLWAESYGGHYGPGFMRFFQEQNDKIADGRLDEEGAVPLHLDTLGIVNGYVDSVVQGQSLIDFPHHANTYGIKLFDDELHAELTANWTRPGGCKEQMQECQRRLSAYDTPSVNRGLVRAEEVCSDIWECVNQPFGQYSNRDNPDARGFYDITHPAADPFPPLHLLGYLNEASTQEALGVPVNFTWAAPAVGRAFTSTADMVHGGFLGAIADLLDRNVSVHMVYGDRDFSCNWVGGEAASEAVPWRDQDIFRQLPYGVLWAPPRGFSGLVRQYGRFSFTRVFGAGHMVPAYVPETAYHIFTRATFGYDIATGTFKVDDTFFTDQPPSDRNIAFPPPPMPKPRCYVLWPGSCTKDAWAKVRDGSAKIVNYYVVEDEEDEDLVVEAPGAEQDALDEL